MLKYKRVLLKLSGELFGDKNGKGIDFTSYERIAKELISAWKKTKIELAIVVGGGNIFRGRERNKKVDEVAADYMGMLATIINGMALQEALERLGAPTRMMTAFEIKAVAEPYIRRRAQRHLKKGRIVIFTAGVGSPFFTTDSGAALRAIEIGCDVILKATDVNGVYSDNPNKNPKAKLYKQLTYQEAIEKNLEVMDATAFALCKKQKMPIIVFNIKKLGSIGKILKGENFGTLVST
ncbi:UMP kinase [Candidatus Woesebacteria bacterium]|nr:MAG: UMP kinase [Candidatus Woesebacteria bacterium]